MIIFGLLGLKLSLYMLVNGIHMLLRHLNVIFKPTLSLIAVSYSKGIIGLQHLK